MVALKTLTITKEISINASAKIVYNALTTSEEIIQYFPLKKVESNWIAGDEIKFIGEVDGRISLDIGIINKLIPNKLFEFSYWNQNHGTERKIENYLTVS